MLPATLDRSPKGLHSILRLELAKTYDALWGRGGFPNFCGFLFWLSEICDNIPKYVPIM